MYKYDCEKSLFENRTIKINSLHFASEETEFSRKNSVSGAMGLPEMSFQTSSKARYFRNENKPTLLAYV